MQGYWGLFEQNEEEEMEVFTEMVEKMIKVNQY